MVIIVPNIPTGIETKRKCGSKDRIEQKELCAKVRWTDSCSHNVMKMYMKAASNGDGPRKYRRDNRFDTHITEPRMKFAVETI